MAITAYWFSVLIGLAIIVIGVRFLLRPPDAAVGYGMGSAPPAPGEFNGWLAVKGVRDIASGLFVFLLIRHGSQHLLGEFVLIASLIPLADAAIVLRSGGSKAAAFGIHGLTALVMIATGVALIAGPTASAG